LVFKHDAAYHTSSILAVSLDSLTLPFRLQTAQACSMNDLVAMVTAGGRTVASAATTFPVPLGKNISISDLLSGEQLARKQILTSLTPNIGQNSTLISNAAVLRGVQPSLAQSSVPGHLYIENSLREKSRGPRDHCDSMNELLRAYFQNVYPGAAHECWSVNQGCMTKPPFPNIFSPCVTGKGFVIEGFSRPHGTNIPQVSALSSLSTCTGIRDMLNSLSSWARKVNIQKYHSFLEAGTEIASFEEAIESIETLAQRYETP